MIEKKSLSTKLRYLGIVFHFLGLTSLFGGLYVCGEVFYAMAVRGYFVGLEPNSLTLSFEICVYGFSVFYLLFLTARYLWHVIKI
jgi:hypothetical protein